MKIRDWNDWLKKLSPEQRKRISGAIELLAGFDALAREFEETGLFYIGQRAWSINNEVKEDVSGVDEE